VLLSYREGVANVIVPTDPWFGKLDADLQEQYEMSPAAAHVECLIFTDTADPVAVERIIREHGGVVVDRVAAVPGLTAELPIGALGVVAASDSVLRIDADNEYFA